MALYTEVKVQTFCHDLMQNHFSQHKRFYSSYKFLKKIIFSFFFFTSIVEMTAKYAEIGRVGKL